MKTFGGADQYIAQWVADRIGYVQSFDKSTAIGILDNSNTVVAGIVYHDYQPKYGTIQLSVAADTPRWATRKILKEVLSYPFNELNVRKAWSATPLKNKRALRFVKGIGFKQEAVLSHQFGDDHAVICRMFKKQFEQLFKE